MYRFLVFFFYLEQKETVNGNTLIKACTIKLFFCMWDVTVNKTIFYHLDHPEIIGFKNGEDLGKKGNG